MHTKTVGNSSLFDLPRFYWNLVTILEDPAEHEEVTQLMAWWNRYVISLLRIGLCVLPTHILSLLSQACISGRTQ